MFQVITREEECHKVFISPEMARDWLKRVPEKQRSVPERRVEAIVQALREGVVIRALKFLPTEDFPEVL